MDEGVLERIKKVIQESDLSVNQFASKIGFKQSNLSQILNGKRNADNRNLIKGIADTFNIKEEWLLYGTGEEGGTNEIIANGVPYYKEVPVSAGRAELMEVEGEENAVGFIKITGVSGKFAFPVIGCSMEPVIHAGDIVVVDELNQWDKIDPDKIYLIFTHDDRMIKHLETDEGNAEILWCVSPNYKRFSIDKTDILKIYKVTFYGRLA